MFSLPPIIPRESLWPLRPTPPTSAHDNNPHNPNTHGQNQPTQPPRRTYNPYYRSTLSSIATDEAAITHRKLNIQRFGATWIKPPGVAKTYQQRMDEESERIEQVELARREAQMLELAAAAEQDNQIAVDEDADADGEEGEVDLDADVPDAPGSSLSASDSESDEDSEEERTEADVTFNEESLLEGSELISSHLQLEEGDGQLLEEESELLDGQREVATEEALLSGRTQEAHDLGLDLEDRDLDDSIPEAGSYEHTDSDESLQSSSPVQNSSPQTQPQITPLRQPFTNRSPIETPQTSHRLGAHRRLPAQAQQEQQSRVAPGPTRLPPGIVRHLSNMTSLSTPVASPLRGSIISDESELASSPFAESSPVLARRHGNGNSVRARQIRGGRRPGLPGM